MLWEQANGAGSGKNLDGFEKINLDALKLVWIW
jgi:hypothetical protein